MKKKLLAWLLVMFSTQTFALFCPNGFNQIDIGDSVDKVTQACGKPDAQKTSKTAENQPQEWNYYVRLDPSQSASVKMTVAFDTNKKVMNITVNAQSLATTSLCGPPISTSDTADTIKTACGKPAFINQSQPQGTPNMTETTELLYNSTPPTTLTFENGKLKSRTQ